MASDIRSDLVRGAQLGHYRIDADLGSGGMGKVYRARDTQLSRDVAIKVLRDVWSTDAETRSRFDREARLLAALNHPHIGAIYGVAETNDGHRALVLELVSGPTLAEIIAKGPLPLKDALNFAAQIADALDAAHERGIIHRDLKPANIKITPDGQVKVLDFGLAKLASADGDRSDEFDAANAPTAAADETRQGAILGTIAYMSPEQARGLEIDKRSDVWAFGCVLYETLTGRALFHGETSTDVLVAVLNREVNFDALPGTTPTGIRKLLRRCLERDRRRRLRDIADARIEIEETLHPPAESVVAIPPVRLTWYVVIAMIALAAAIGAAAGWYVKPTPDATATSPVGVQRLFVTPSEPVESIGPGRTQCAAADCSEGAIAISPDGRRVVYVARAGGRQQLYLRELDRFDSVPIAGTEDGHTPTFSPDGRSLAFLANRKLWKTVIDGGRPQLLVDFVEGPGLSWADDNTIFFNPGSVAGIWRVSADGGTAAAVSRIEGKEDYHRFPHALPGARALLFNSGSGTDDDEIYVQSLETGQRKRLVQGRFGHYIATGHLAFVQGGTLFAAPFDLTRLEITGAPVAVVQDVQSVVLTPQVAFSKTGSLIYLTTTGVSPELSMVWVDRQGNEKPTGATGRSFTQPRIAPDGNRLAVSLRARGLDVYNSVDVWSFDFEREAWSRMTYDGQSSFPVWTPDGKRLTLASGKAGPPNVFWKALDGGESSETRLFSGDHMNLPLSWSPDSRFLAYVDVDTQTAQDIWVFTAGGASEPFLRTRFREGAPQFSPDGNWIVYASDESGRNEVYIRPFPGPGDKYPVSVDGGVEPIWPRNSQELFYRNGDAVMVVEVSTRPTLRIGKPRLLFEKAYEHSGAYWPNYDVTPDGQRLLMIKAAGQAPLPTRINLVLNWAQELKQRFSTK